MAAKAQSSPKDDQRRTIMSATATATDFVTQYVGIWNERDGEIRRALVRDLWADDAVEWTENNEYRGHAALEERVTGAHQEFVVNGGFQFRLADPPATHHGAVTFRVEMVPVAGGVPVWVGDIFLLRDGDGRIREDYHFGRYVG